MNRRKFTALALTGAVASTVAFTAAPAYAVPRTFVVTLLGGSQVTVTVDVPAETPPSAISFPGVDLPVVSVQEVTPTPVPSPTPTVTAPPLPTLTPTTPPSSTATPGSTPSPSGQSPQSTPGSGGQQQTTQATELRRPTGEEGVVPDLATALKRQHVNRERKKKDPANPGRNTDGSPTPENPAFTLALPGAAPVGVPNFFIDRFRIPPFLLPIYQAAGIQYGVRWEVLAAINEIETDYGRNLNVSSAGALGWMQFMPATWRAYGVDANKDGLKDPYNPVDAIFAAARYLRAAGAETDLRRAIFAYNHADWYVDSVLLRARVLGGLPSNFVGSLTGLTQGRFPVAARATYADDLSEAEVADRKRSAVGNAAWLVQSQSERRGINIYSREGAPVIAVNDGRITDIGENDTLGRYVVLEDVFGNEFTYAHLGAVAKLYPAAKEEPPSSENIEHELALPKPDKAPTESASAGMDAVTSVTDALRQAVAGKVTVKPDARTTSKSKARPEAQTAQKERLFANPLRTNATKAGGAAQVLEGKASSASYEVFRRSVSAVFGADTKSEDVTLKPLKKGSRVIAGTVLGRIGGMDSAGVAPHVAFAIRPAGRGAPKIDPKPILDGWKLLETTAIYRAQDENPFSSGAAPSIGQVLLMDKQSLQRMVLADPRIDIYEGGRHDIRLGLIDRRVLATLEFLSLSGFKPTVTSLRSGHSYLTASGNVSEHSSGNAVDIAAINGIPILGHQGSGSITDIVVQRLTTLQGLMRPHQIISLMQFPNADNTFAMSDHDDHIHVGFQPLYGTNSKQAREVDATLKPDQWIKLVDRLGEIDEPVVPAEPSKYALRVARKGGPGAD
jgi:transglycosylase-like protein with SLT domain